MIIGITSSAYLRRYGEKEGAKRMRAHGYGAIDYQDFIDTETDFFNLNELDFKNRIAETKKIVEGEGLFFSQAHGPWRYPPREFEPADRKERFEAMCKAIRGTSYLGTKNFVIHPFMPFGLEEQEAEPMKEINAELFYKLCAHAQDYGVDVCLENMPFVHLPISSVETVVEFVEKMNIDNLKICLDTGHDLVWGRQPSQSVRQIGDKLACIHAHDNDGKGDFHWLIKKGVCNWEDFVKSLKESTYSGVFSLETSAEVSENKAETERREIELINTVKEIIKV